MKKFIVFIIIIVISAAAVMYYKYTKDNKNRETVRYIPVKRETIIVKALAIGQINPRQEVDVKSKIRGIVKNKYIEVGDPVKKGDPLMDVDPDPTPQEYSRAKRQMELARIAMINAEKEYRRYEQLRGKQWVSQQETEDYKEIFDDKELRFKLAEEDFDLISKGKIDVYGKAIDNIIKSPIDGIVLQMLVDQGDPVVPLLPPLALLEQRLRASPTPVPKRRPHRARPANRRRTLQWHRNKRNWPGTGGLQPSTPGCPFRNP